MELAQNKDSSATLTLGEFARNLQPLPTAPKLRAARQQLSSVEDIKLRQCKPGELSWLATVSRPDICARLARIASHINSLQGSDVYRITDLVETVKLRQAATVLKYASFSQLGKSHQSKEGEKMHQRNEKVHGGTMTLVGRSYATYRIKPARGNVAWDM